ncbi:nucleotide-binding universal stress UspA family protein [Evansella vedderi]|uniref:Nucleotide-binding universal stress UspA family protein n=1 Tax=Evansella vedderi TaxID=38282 RepID=A0ABT9ZWY1_9BACI|nr:universal stress protein [Evansella vedderi]MDQ0255739.1 nucleotide-binding universal stress UspA family protein [Evansella vedderi]
MFKNILLAADGSTHSKRATEKALYLAKLSDESIITLVHVVDDLPARSDVLDGTMYSRITMPDYQKERTYEIEEWINREGISLEVKHVYGEPGSSIVREANNGDYDLVVIGSRGLNPFQQMVLGSVSHKVAKRVKCPILIVK